MLKFLGAIDMIETYSPARSEKVRRLQYLKGQDPQKRAGGSERRAGRAGPS